MAEIDFEINGYIINNNHEAYFKIQRRINPGGRVSFENAFKTLGKKSGLRGLDFLRWLKENHFNDPGWKFVDFNDEPLSFHQELSSVPEADNSINFPLPEEKVFSTRREEEPVEIAPARGAGKRLERTVKNQVARGTEITPSSIVSADYSKAEGMIALCKDKSVLKKALNLTKHFSNKEQHMRQIIKRLEQVV